MNFKHGHRNHPSYTRYCSMIQRCYNPRHINYKNYGAKGIKVEEYLQDLKNYCNYVDSLKDANKIGYTIDRIDVNVGYCRGNLRWVDSNVQASNKGLREDNSSGIPGIGYCKYFKKWRARVSYNNVSYLNRYFKEFRQAVESRDKVIIENNLPHPLSTSY